MVVSHLHSIGISIINMLLIKVAFLSILIQYGQAGSYFGRGNADTVGKMTLKENYKSIIKKLHQYLKHDLNMELLIRNLQRNTSNSTDGCIKHLLSMNKAQLISVIDASFKPNPGILEGNVNWMGNYRECMQTDGLHYCTMTNVVLNIGQNVPFTLGLCVPEQCNSEDVTYFFSLLSNFTRYGNTSFINVIENALFIQEYGSDAVCSEKKISYSNGAVVMITISFLIIAVCITGTLTEFLKGSCVRKEPYKILVEPINDLPEENGGVSIDQSHVIDKNKPQDISMHDVTVSEKDSFLINFLLCFSIIKNTKAVLNTDVPGGSITVINGMRTLSITWVVLGHTLGLGVQFSDDPIEILSWTKWFSFQAMLNATVSVDSFFLLSGLLVSYLSMKRFKTKGTLPLVRYYLHRYIRLTPSYAYLLFFFTYILPIVASGPSWFMNGRHSPLMKNCISYWWTNLLYINNFYPKLQYQCVGFSWYLANDMQFYVVSPIILFAMYKLRLIGVALVNGVLILACCIINGVLIYHYDAAAVFPVDNVAFMADPNSPANRYMRHIYMKPYARIGPYLIGLILGYVISNKYSFNGIYKKYIYLCGWVVAIGFGVAIVYGPYSQYQYTWRMVDQIVYGVTFRVVWAMALAWVIFACHNGWGGYIDKLLSWKAFIPLSRLTYGVYLIHPIILYWYFGSLKAIIDMSIFELIIIFLGITVLSFLGAFVTSVCIEYPVFNLEKLITSRQRTS